MSTLFIQYTPAPTDRAVGTITVVNSRIEHDLQDVPMDDETLVFVDRNTNQIIYAGTSSLNVNHLGRMSNHTVRDTTHDWLSWYIRLACQHVDLYLVTDDRYATLTKRSANKRAQLTAAVNRLEGNTDVDAVRSKLSATDQEIGELLTRLTTLHAQRAVLTAAYTS